MKNQTKKSLVAELAYGGSTVRWWTSPGYGSCSALLTDGRSIDFDELTETILGEEYYDLCDHEEFMCFSVRVMQTALRLAGVDMVIDEEHPENNGPLPLAEWSHSDEYLPITVPAFLAHLPTLETKIQERLDCLTPRV